MILSGYLNRIAGRSTTFNTADRFGARALAKHGRAVTDSARAYWKHRRQPGCGPPVDRASLGSGSDSDSESTVRHPGPVGATSVRAFKFTPFYLALSIDSKLCNVSRFSCKGDKRRSRWKSESVRAGPGPGGPEAAHRS
jgi:hypothetical protein